MKRNVINYIVILLVFTLVGVILYKFSASLLISGSDSFEYSKYSNLLIQNGKVDSLSETNLCTSCERFPIYSKFPGLPIIITVLSLLTNQSSLRIIIILNFLLLVPILVYMFLVTKNLSRTQNNKSILIFFSLLYFTLLSFSFYLLVLPTLIGFLFFIVFIYMSISNKIEFSTYLQISLIFILSLFLYHHVSSVILFVIFVPIFIISLTYHSNKKELVKKKTILTVFFFIALFALYFFNFIYPDFNNLLSILAAKNTPVSSSDYSLLEYNSIYPFFLITIVITFLSTFYIPLKYGLNGKKGIIVIALTTIAIIWLLQPILFSKDIMCSRFRLIWGFMFIFSCLSVMNEGRIFKTVRSVISFIFVILTIFLLVYVISLPTVITNNYINTISSVKLSNEGCVYSDPTTLFVIGGIRNIDECYFAPRPTRGIRDYYFNEIPELKIIGTSDGDELYHELKNINTAYLIYDSLFTPSWSTVGDKEMLESLDIMYPDKFIRVEEEVYQKDFTYESKKYSEVKIIIYEVL